MSRALTTNPTSRLARFAALAITLAASGAAFAETPNFASPAPAASVLSHADVQASVLQARLDGQLRMTDADLAHIAPTQSLRSRDEVRAETLAAVSSGWRLAGSGEIDTRERSGPASGATPTRYLAARTR